MDCNIISYYIFAQIKYITPHNATRVIISGGDVRIHHHTQKHFLEEWLMKPIFLL